ncbi:uncharacterized protein EAF01_008524 [Botrytis porri]|uniref:uncharacterized protein n=1 Tax=Botrytis porri TaxID=87229 RepID=UPI0018FF7B06|nr:uncharacterized protein EAF01_008524 [Botrytis porri]KAF7899311.1 hypothetical protein EAF01_008524 [Botrytis porri]
MAHLTASLLSNELVQIIVGPELKEFFVHKTLIRSTCDFFDKAFNGRFKEGIENKMHLPKDDPEIFEIFVNWMYSGHLRGGLREPMLIINIWIFAQKCQAITLKNCAMKALQDALGDERIGRFPLSNSEVAHIYENTTWGDELRVFAIAMLAWEIPFGDPEDAANLERIFNDVKSALEEVLEFTQEFGGKPVADPRVRGGSYDKCAFHEHNDKDEYVCIAALNSHQYRNIH